jgi:alpha-glucosidase
MNRADHQPWWLTGVIYQVYPRSFQDSNADGVGDLPGITARLDYLRDLPINAIWLSPVFASPMADFGYDISDFTAIDPIFGTLDDFDELILEAHRRGIRVILDLVPNHTSDEHPWFVESAESRDNPRRDWYIWADASPKGGPPNNWTSMFSSESAWQWHDQSDQYYLRTFDSKQPDLNWRNPAVRAAMYDVMRFWLDRGADGFRVDVAWLLLKDAQLRDNPANPDWQSGAPPWGRHVRLYTENQAGIHAIMQEMRQVTDAYPDRILIGEIFLPVEQLVTYYGNHSDELHLPFNFALLDITAQGWNAGTLHSLISSYESALPQGAWPNWVLANHDSQRTATRIGAAQAKVAAMLLLTLRGTPTWYYGEELGMIDGDIPPDRVQDPQAGAEGAFGRDPARTPMPWDTSRNAGFTRPHAFPWLPVSLTENGNVAAQQADPASMLSLVRKLLCLRQEHNALTVGSLRLLPSGSGDVLAYMREHSGQRILIVLNLTNRPTNVELGDVMGRRRLLCSTALGASVRLRHDRLQLEANEGLVVEILPRREPPDLET